MTPIKLSPKKGEAFLWLPRDRRRDACWILASVPKSCKQKSWATSTARDAPKWLPFLDGQPSSTIHSWSLKIKNTCHLGSIWGRSFHRATGYCCLYWSIGWSCSGMGMNHFHKKMQHRNCPKPLSDTVSYRKSSTNGHELWHWMNFKPR